MQSRKLAKAISALGTSIILFSPVNIPKAFPADGPKIEPIVSVQKAEALGQEEIERRKGEEMGRIQVKLIKHILWTNNDSKLSQKDKAAERANRIIDSLMDVYIVYNSTATEAEQNATYATLIKEVDALKGNFRQELSKVKDEDEVAPIFSELVGWFEDELRGIITGILLADSSKDQEQAQNTEPK